jgi:hypothetical protein
MNNFPVEAGRVSMMYIILANKNPHVRYLHFKALVWGADGDSMGVYLEFAGQGDPIVHSWGLPCRKQEHPTGFHYIYIWHPVPYHR